ncbi:MAG: hypothetical protein VB049_10175 [Candidatus Pelethousia sp.]|nr:hypothetical protein [Candidatus Pelethousia sp.]
MDTKLNPPSISGAVRRYIACAFLLAAIGAYATFPTMRRMIAGEMMLFSQRSVQVLEGAIRSAKAPALRSIFLAAFQTAVIPWMPPRIFLAATACLGYAWGGFCSIFGNAVGASLWYAIVRALRGGTQPVSLQNASGNLLFPLGLACLSGMSALSAIAAGALLIRYKHTVGGVCAFEFVRLLLYLKYCSSFSALLPMAWQVALWISGGMLILAWLLFQAWYYKKKRQE